jgi:hypothetical protein
MTLRSMLLLIILLLLAFAYRPRVVWRELMQVWGRRKRVLRTLVVVITIYFIYGLYTIYQRGMLDGLSWPW